ncbi:MAG: DUF4670 domain-containing protein [Bacteroidales bacterium]|jgi:uncharacterized protein YacL (UPF0231 family)|nr:DUF4670 domain-containing protein [Bacteroidales bacterium]
MWECTRCGQKRVRRQATRCKYGLSHNWVDEEILEDARKLERIRKEKEAEEKERQRQEWLKTEEGLLWLAEQERLRIEKEKNEKREAERKARNERNQSILSWLFAIANCAICYAIVRHSTIGGGIVLWGILFVLIVIASKILIGIYFAFMEDSRVVGKIFLTLIFVILAWPLLLRIGVLVSNFAVSVSRSNQGVETKSNIIQSVTPSATMQQDSTTNENPGGEN